MGRLGFISASLFAIACVTGTVLTLNHWHDIDQQCNAASQVGEKGQHGN